MYLLLLIANLFSVTPDIDSRNISDCQSGGVYLNNAIELAMCWGDSKFITEWNMSRQGFVRTYDYPNTPDAQFFVGGIVFGSDVHVVRLLFKGDSLVEIYTIFQNIGTSISYSSMSQTYEEFRDYFTDSANGYTTLEDTPDDKVFSGQYSSCTGDCGMVMYGDRLYETEVNLFMVGKAKQVAIFLDNYSMAGIRIEVPHWTVQYTSGARQFSLTVPYFTLCFSEPRGSIARRMAKSKRRM
jgi:hypothetical protein